MEKDQKPRREGAGLNRHLSADYVWPSKFGASNIRNAESEKRSLPDNLVASGKAPSTSSKKTSSSKHSHVSLEKKKLAIITEKKRQELERKKRQMERNEIEDSIRLLEMEHDLQNAIIEEQEDERSENSTITDIIDSPIEENDKHRTVTDWINQTPEDTHEQIGNKPENNDIKLLCETLSNVLKSVAPSNDKKSTKFLARHTVDKDFPHFDGNPQEWPLFYKQFKNICSLCEYSSEEIMLKLQKSLKGEAKAAVAGMMLTSENTDLVMQTLEMRFGRPEYIIDAMLSNIKSFPYIRDMHLERLIQFSTEVSNVVSTMKTLNTMGHLQNPQLLKDLLYKLPDALKLKWGEVIVSRKGQVSLEDFSKWVGEIANAACYVSTPRGNNFEKFPQNKSSFHAKKIERVFSTKDLKDHDKCHYCEKKHQEELCPQMKIDHINKRWSTVTNKKLCFSCLRKNHQKFKCRKRKKCQTNGCEMYHHYLLHKDLTKPNSERFEEPSEEKVEMVCAMRHDTNKILLRMIPVKLYGPAGNISVLALCDEASTVTLLDSKIATKLGLTGSKETLCLQWTNDQVSSQENSLRMDVHVSKTNKNDECFIMKGVHTIENLSLPEQTIIMNEWKKYKHLKGLPIADIRNEKPVLLIGQDNVNLIVARQIRSGPENMPVASRCKLGWAIHGPCNSKTDHETIFGAHTLHICERSNKELKRLHCVEKKCGKNDILAKDYCDKIRDYEKKGYIRKLTPKEAEMESPHTWYLPHFPVHNPIKQNQISIGWKSSSEDGNNSCQEEEEVSEYKEHHEEEPLQFKSDHEFSPESDLECDEPLPLKRARTDRKEESDDEELDEEFSCQKCDKSDHPEWSLLCDNGWHCSCLRPPLFVIPAGDWYCPSCQHEFIENLSKKLIEFDKSMLKKEMEDRRKERLAYVGIRSNNVLPAKEKKDKKSHQSSESEGTARENTPSGFESEASDSDEPSYQLRQRRQVHGYKFQDYGDLINSSLDEEPPPDVEKTHTVGRGKDIATIVNAAKEEEKNGFEDLPPVVPRDPEENTKKAMSYRKKPKRLNNSEVNSDDEADDSVEVFKGSSSAESDEGTYAEDSDGIFVGKKSSLPVRRSTRARTTRFDDDFINDGSEEGPSRKKKKTYFSDSESSLSDDWRGKKSNKSFKHTKSVKKKKMFDDSDLENYRKKNSSFLRQEWRKSSRTLW